MDQPPIPNQSTPPIPTSPPVISPKPSRSLLPLLVMGLMALLGITAAAFFMIQNFQLKQQPAIAPASSPPEPSAQAEPTPAPIPADWQSYTNQKPYFSFNYPSSWSMSSSDDQVVVFETGNRNTLKIIITPDNSPTIAAYLEKTDQTSQSAYEGRPSLQVQTTKKTQINGLNCIQREEYLLAADMSRIATYYKSGNTIVAITLEAIPGNSWDQDKEMYQQLLSTLMFTK